MHQVKEKLKTMAFSENSNTLVGMSICLEGGWLGTLARLAARSQMMKGTPCSAKESACNPLAQKRY